jgi:hypothetical protein
MWRKPATLLVALAVAALAAWALPAAGGATAQTTLQWTMNGNPVGPPITAPLDPVANDFHPLWGPRGQARLRWTVDGQPVGPIYQSPDVANDVELIWNAQTDRFTAAFWTRDGQRIAQIPIVPGANDVHVRLMQPRQFTFAVWTHNGLPIPPPLQIPPGANGFDLKL